MIRNFLFGLILVLTILLFVASLENPAGNGEYSTENIERMSDSAKNRLDFDPLTLAEAELRMWKAYYGGDPVVIKAEISYLLQSQFNIPEKKADSVAKDLLKATVIFKTSKHNYNSVLPYLESAYGQLKDLTDGDWDANAAAAAELEWWVKRRTPGRGDPGEVGGSIAKLYAILYGQTNENIQNAGRLRARAAYLRDAGHNWQEVGNLLRQSYQELHKGMNS